MKYHIITPFARFENLTAQINHIRSHGPDISWDVLLDGGAPFQVFIDGAFARPFYFPPAKPFWRAWANHLNGYINLACIVPEDRYLIMNDDDFYEPGFFEKLNAVPGEFIVCSMKRGNHTPDSGPMRSHPTETLIACPANMTVGRVGCEQMIVSGRLFQTIHFVDDLCADGLAIVEMAKQHTPKYLPDAFVWFNYLEPGRWSK